MVYDAWRINGLPTQHPPNPTAVTVDVLEIGFIFAIAVLAFCLALVVPGYRGWARLCFCCRAIVSLFILGAVLLGVLGQEWANSEIHTRTPYKAYIGYEIDADIGMKIGLASVNITLKTNPVTHQFPNNVTETINYNERFHWDWRQGRLGFGPYEWQVCEGDFPFENNFLYMNHCVQNDYASKRITKQRFCLQISAEMRVFGQKHAGKIQQEFRSAQFRGLPLPILWVAEYFTLDGEMIRWGRSFRTAGWFTHIVLWTAFPTWIIANLLSIVVLFYAGISFVITGLLMLTAVVIWSTIRWGHQPLAIPFEDGSLTPHYGPSFWLVVSGGIVSFLYGAVIICMDLWAPQLIADFFGNDVLQDAEDFFPHKDEDKDEEPLQDGVNEFDPETPRKSMQMGGVKRRAQRQSIIAKLKPTQRRKSRQSISNDIRKVIEENTYENEGMTEIEENGMNGRMPSSQHTSSYATPNDIQHDPQDEAIYENENEEEYDNTAI